jgi:4-amino-4-deoxy-L-arabinose transferase-like glycosyltransferase
VTPAWFVLPLFLFAAARTLHRRLSWRESFGAAWVIFGAAATIATESLSVFSALSIWPVFLFWLAASVAMFLIRGGVSEGSSISEKPGRLDWILLASAAAVCLPVGLIAWASPPNSTDAMAYHLPRVVYWVQQASVRFYPTHYPQQDTFQPLAEYLALHTWILSGGDRLVNFVQYFAMLASTLLVSLAAKKLGSGLRGQMLGAFCCVTLPNGILQASGAKNDYVLASWLAAMLWFALRLRRNASKWNVIGTATACGLALLTKGTAYLFVPPLLAAVLWPARRFWLGWIPMAACCVLAINGPYYWRNWNLSGSPFGFSSAHGDGRFRFSPDHIDVRTTLSTALRAGSEHLAARSEAWNRGVYDGVVTAHEWLGMSVNDPATTWPDAVFEPPRNSNHEANASNRWHLLLLALTVPVMILDVRRGKPDLLYLGAGLTTAFVLFCAFLRWQPFMMRLQLPLFVCAMAVLGVALARFLPVWAQFAVCLLLLDKAKPFVLENWVRPLKGPESVLSTVREENYFRDLRLWNNRDSYVAAAQLTIESGCDRIGIDASENQIEYPYQILVLRKRPTSRFTHVNVENPTRRYAEPAQVCAVLCLDCVGKPTKEALYSSFDRLHHQGLFLVALRNGPYSRR